MPLCQSMYLVSFNYIYRHLSFTAWILVVDMGYEGLASEVLVNCICYKVALSKMYIHSMGPEYLD